MPYLAYELDALEDAPNVARAAQISEDTAIAGLLRTWRHCWRKKTDTVSITALQGFFGQDVTPALMEWSFVEAGTDGLYRVRGAERYLRISKARSDNGKQAAARGNLKRGKTAPAVSPAGLQQVSSSSPVALQQASNSAPALTASSEQRAAVEASREPPPLPERVGGVEKPPEPEEFEADTEGEFRPTAWGFWGWHNQERLAQQLFAEPRPPDKLREWHDAAQALVGIPGLIRAYQRYLADPHFADRGWTFAMFMSDGVWLPRANDAPRRGHL